MTATGYDDRADDRVLPPPHTHHIGPLCQGWEYEEDPISREVGFGQDRVPEECDHGSCLELVNEDCEGCQYEGDFR